MYLGQDAGKLVRPADACGWCIWSVYSAPPHPSTAGRCTDDWLPGASVPDVNRWDLQDPCREGAAGGGGALAADAAGASCTCGLLHDEPEDDETTAGHQRIDLGVGLGNTHWEMQPTWQCRAMRQLWEPRFGHALEPCQTRDHGVRRECYPSTCWCEQALLCRRHVCGTCCQRYARTCAGTRAEQAACATKMAGA